MLSVVVVVLGLYSLPLLGIVLSFIMSAGFTENSVTVSIASTIAIEFLQTLRDGFGTLLVPILTALVVHPTGADGRLPARTVTIFIGLAVLFLISVAAVGVASPDSVSYLKHYGDNVPDAFTKTARSYAKELLTYMALTLGISLKRG